MANESLHGRPLKPEELENIQYQIETVSEIRGIVDGTGREMTFFGADGDRRATCAHEMMNPSANAALIELAAHWQQMAQANERLVHQR
jgi:hypothetical protein